MYRAYYQLHAEPFRLTPDARFVYHHASYSKALGYMQFAMEQGDGILVITGRSGTGKTTLADFLAKLSPGNRRIATLASSDLETEDLLRMVGHAFGLDVKGLDKATLLCELEAFLRRQTHALLIIDEAQNLSAAALEEVRLLTDMHIGSRALLQAFLLGQEQLHERLHTTEMEQFHQRLVAACVLEPLSLQETHDYVVHRLVCAGWRGSPAFDMDTFVLIHRFSQGLPRYINKFCTRLLLQGAVERRQRLGLDDVVAVIGEIRDELLLPLPAGASCSASESLPPIEHLVQTRGQPVDLRLTLTREEQVFIRDNPLVTKIPPEPEVAVAPQARSEKPATAPAPPRPPDRQPGKARARLSSTRAIHLAPYLERLESICRDLAEKSRGGLRLGQSKLESLIRAGRQMAQGVDVSSFQKRVTRLYRGFGQGRLAVSGAAALLVLAGAYLSLSGDPGQGEAADEAELLTFSSTPPSPPASTPVAEPSPPAPTPKPTTPTTVGATAMAAPEAVPAALTLPPEESTMRKSPAIEPRVEAEARPEISPGSQGGTATIADTGARSALDSTIDQFPASAGGDVVAVSYTSQHEVHASGKPQPDLLATAPDRAVVNAQQVEVQEDNPTGIQTSAVKEGITTIEFNSTEPLATSGESGTDPAVEVWAESAPEDQEHKIEDLLVLAEEAIARDKLRVPEKDSAWHHYKQVLEIDPDNQAAESGLQRIAARYAALAVDVMEKKQYDKAHLYIQRGLGVVAGHDELTALQSEANARQAEFVAMQERERQLAMEAAQAASEQTIDEPEPPRRGFMGTLKKFFGGDKAQASSQ